MAPVFTLPAFAATRKGRWPARRSAATAARRSAMSMRKSSPTFTLRGAPSPSVKAAFSRQEWPSADMYMVSRGRPWRPSARMSQPLTLGTPVPCDLQAMPVRVRSPAEEDPVAPVLGEADELHEPADDCSLHVYSRVITAGAARVGNR